MWHFLDASMHLYKRVSPFVRWSVSPSVSLSLLSVHNTFVLYLHKRVIPASELEGREKEKGELRRAGKEVTRGGEGVGDEHIPSTKRTGGTHLTAVYPTLFSILPGKKKKKNVCSIKQ